MDVWPWGACWLQDEACQFKGLERLEGLRAGKRQAWLQDEACQVSFGRVSQSIGGGVPSQQCFKGFKLFRGLERFRGSEGLRAGKRQAWTPIRSHGCVALGCLLAAG